MVGWWDVGKGHEGCGMVGCGMKIEGWWDVG